MSYLKFIIGDDLKILSDGEDITQRLHIKRLSLDLLPNEGTVVTMEVYAQEVVIEPREVKAS